jgi:potassium efflux system protein
VNEAADDIAKHHVRVSGAGPGTHTGLNFAPAGLMLPRARAQRANLRGCVLLFAFFMLLLAALSARAAEADKSDDAKATAAEKAPAPVAVAVPVSEISAQADAATVNLREIATSATANPLVTDVERDLPAMTRNIDVRLRENARIISQHPSVELLRTLERSWNRMRTTLSVWRGDLDERIAALDRESTRLDELETTWKETHALAAKEQAPPELVRRAQEVLQSAAKTRTAVDQQRALALRLQSRVAAQEFRLTEAVDAIGRVRDAALARIFSRDSAPLWSGQLLSRAGEQIAVDSEESRQAQVVALTSYLESRSDRVLLHALVFAALAALLYWARRRINAWAREEPGLHRPALVFAWPIATALLLAFIGSRWIYPEAPRLLWAVVGAAALIPTVLVLRRLISAHLVPLLYVVVALFFVDQLRAIAASIELVPRLIFFFEMIGGAVFLLWFMRRPQNTAVDPSEPQRSRTLTRLALRAALAFFVLTALCNAVGYLSLANLLGNAALRSMYFGLILYALVEILDALVIMALRVRPLRLLGMVQRHRELLRRRTRLVLNALALLLWSLFALDRLAVRQRVIGGITQAFTTNLTIGSISISLADVLAFVLAVWASFLVSRFARFVLDEEVYPHAKLKRGLPYAISQTLHYLVLVIGFFVAMAALGLDMTKFTILASAFTVGVGFGLQNIFNNFVSGVILLYERPVQVGDVIQVGDTAGVVERIGIRASIVRTPSGSEIIMPNGKLISDQLINWTFSDRQRGLEMPVSVVLGSDPRRVVEILEGAAKDHPKLVAKPPPKALVTRLGPDWMGFELHAATDHIDDWVEVRSELAIAMHEALKRENVTLR